MFDRTFFYGGNTHHRVTLEEKRAPTDESVRLLREMETKAREQVIKSVSLPGNDLRGTVHVMRDPLSCGSKVVFLFELNGKKHQHQIFLDEFRHDSPEAVSQHMVDELSRYLASAILQKIVAPNFAAEIGKNL